MTRVRVVRSFIHDGRRLKPGEVLELSPAYARALITDGTVELVVLPAHRYQNRMLVSYYDRRIGV